jgi:hypothetical protein
MCQLVWVERNDMVTLWVGTDDEGRKKSTEPKRPSHADCCGYGSIDDDVGKIAASPARPKRETEQRSWWHSRTTAAATTSGALVPHSWWRGYVVHRGSMDETHDLWVTWIRESEFVRPRRAWRTNSWKLVLRPWSTTKSFYKPTCSATTYKQ